MTDRIKEIEARLAGNKWIFADDARYLLDRVRELDRDSAAAKAVNEHLEKAIYRDTLPVEFAKLTADNERLTGEVKRLCDTLTTIADRNFEDEETAAAYAKTSVMISLMGRTSGEEG